MQTRAGFVSIIGKPNTGKSTLLNAILGTKLSITTSKPQTTRRRVLGIYSAEDFQIVFADTPGLLKPRYMMHELMMEYISDSVSESDVLLMVTDMADSPDEDSEARLIEIVRKFNGAKILVLNKVDALGDRKRALPLIEKFSILNIFDEIVPVSSLYSDNIEKLITLIGNYLPEGEFYYDPELLSIHPERFFVGELIREKIFELFEEEIPYSTEVQITSFKERAFGKWHIAADIIVERDSQKKIIIGEDGNKIKQIGQIARKHIEDHLGHNIYLELFVKVRQNWRNDKNRLKGYGY
jgi:GTP-binding protein Era